MTPAPPPVTPWLRLARLAWLAFFVLALGTFLVALPARWTELARPTPLVQAHLATLGWPVRTYAAVTLAVEVLFTAAFLAVALLIFARRSDDRMALFTALMLVAFGVGNQNITPTVGALRGEPIGSAVYLTFAFFAWATFTQFPYIFPTGRYVPGWTRITGVAWFLLTIPWNFMVGTALDPLTWPLGLFLPLILALYISFAVSQVYRFTRVSTPVERQQTKWVAFALVLVIAAILIEFGIYAQFGSDAVTYLSSASGDPPTADVFAAVRVGRAIFALLFVFLPAGMAISILRYRLWDIDVLIRRTLVYSVLTGLLALGYFGTVLSLEGLLRGVIGGESPLVIVLSTLLIAALFVPLRSRVQQAIDRAFYRRKYDAARTLAAFAASARDETDLQRLNEQLVGVVDETMQPERVGLWLKQ